MKNSPDYFNTVIAVITYNPTNGFENRIRRYVEIANKIVVIDNGSIENISSYIPEEIKKHFVIIKSCTNKGIAWGLNQGVLYAKNHGFLYILTFDQDSFPICEILKCYAEVVSKVDNVGLIGTSFTDREIARPFHITYRSKKTLITSGTLHLVSIFDVVGLYDERLFIDSVDFDFVLRVRKKYEVLCVNEPLIYHELGSPIVKYGISSSNHNIVRRYYMSRNHVLICRRYWKDYPIWILKKSLMFFVSIIKMIIVENDVKEKIFSTMRGFRDAFKME